MSFLRNIWYTAAWSDEIGRTPLARRVLNEPLALFRCEDGSPVAIGNVCPHRFASLSHGQLVGDTLECPYHGLRFDAKGACIFNPHGDGRITERLGVAHYPLVERYGVVWIWMGERALCNPSLIPDFSHLVDPLRRHVRPAPALVKANYELVTDNLMDLSHIAYVHRASAGLSDFAQSSHDVLSVGHAIQSNFNYCRGHSKMAEHLGDVSMLVDSWFEMAWYAPSCLALKSGATPTGEVRGAGISTIGTHLLTPETETSTHYFISNSRSFATNDAEVDELLKTWQQNALMIEDKVILEDVQRNMGTTDLIGLHPALLANDKAGMMVRRRLAQMIRQEKAALAAA